MSFLSPAFLWALPLLAVPVLIHLFGKRRRTVIRWGAMHFLLGSATPRRSLMRLRDLILMLLRVAAVLLIVGALSQPVLLSSHLGSAGPRDVVLVLDNSLSTKRTIENETVFQRELAEVRRLLHTLNSTDKIRVLLPSPRPAWVTSGPVTADASHVSSLLAQLEAMAPNDGTADFYETLQRAISVKPAGKDYTRFVTVITDGQRYGWHAENPGQWAAIRALAAKASPPVLTRIVVAGAAGSIGNLTVEKLTVDRAVAGIGQPVTFSASIKNNGTAANQTGTLGWQGGERSLGFSAIPSLEPGAGTTIRMSQPFATPGVFEISCKLSGQDELVADDSSTVLVEVTRAVKVLLVEGETRPDPVQSEIHYFLAALGYDALKAPSASAFQPKVIGYRALPVEDFADVHCIVLADVPRLSVETVQKLARYVRSGGGLWIALGEQTDVRAFNESFFEQGVGVSPLPLLQAASSERSTTNGIALAPPAAEHPATALLSDLQRLDIDRVKIYRRHQFVTSPGNSVPVLLRAQGGEDLAVEKSIGRGRVIVQAFPLGLAWSNLPLCHSFVVMAHEWLWYLAEPSLVKRNLQAGELLQTVRIADSGPVATLETPEGSSAQLIGLEQDGRLAFRYAKTQLPGLYHLTFAGGTSQDGSGKFIVNRDPEESNLEPLSAQQIEALSQTGGISFGAEPLYVPAGQKLIPQPRALAGSLLLSMLGIMLLEVTVAFWFARQRNHIAPAVVMEPAIRI